MKIVKLKHAGETEITVPFGFGTDGKLWIGVGLRFPGQDELMLDIVEARRLGNALIAASDRARRTDKRDAKAVASGARKAPPRVGR